MRHAAPVEVIGETIGRILTADAGDYENGAALEVQEIAKSLGLL